MRRDVFQGIADPTRRAILGLIAVHAMTPTALATHFNTSRQAVSNHLKILTECELICPVPGGREIHYHLAPLKMREVDTWLEKFRILWETRLNQLDQVLSNLKSDKNEK